MLCCSFGAAQKFVRSRASEQPSFVVGEHGHLALATDDAQVGAMGAEGQGHSSELAATDNAHNTKVTLSSTQEAALVAFSAGIIAIVALVMTIVVIRRFRRSPTVQDVEPPRTPAPMSPAMETGKPFHNPARPSYVAPPF